MAYGAAHRRVSARLLVVAASIAMVAALPGSAAQASGHEGVPIAKIEAPSLDGSSSFELETASFGFGPGGDRLFVFTAPGDAPGPLDAFLLDACDSAGQSWVLGANRTDEPLEVTLSDPGSGRSSSYEAPAASSPGGEPGAFFYQHAFSCDDLDPSNPVRLPDLTGTASYDGIRRQCGSFDAPFVIGQSRPGRSYDRITFRGTQQNRFISEQPVIALDKSNIFDEITILQAPPGIGPFEVRDDTFEGLVVGGGPGSLPNANRLGRAIERLTPEELTSIVASAVARVSDDKRPNKLFKALGVKGNPCAYHVQVAFDDGFDPEAIGELLDVLQPLPPVISGYGRFKVEIDWADGSTAELPSVDIRGFADAAAGEDSGSAWFFDPDQSEALVKVLDGCGFNGHHWVFAAANTDVGYTLNVTDTQSGEVRSYEAPLGQRFEPIMDTEAFATCP
jgi:hypothetical protein